VISVDPLYFTDCYLKEFDAAVVSADGVDVVLDRTCFYATGGGQPNDTGKIICNGNEYKVLDVKKSGNGTVHVLSMPGLKQGDIVRGIIDWDRRYRFMKMHTAAHILASVVSRLTGALITGKQLKPDESRIDFSIEEFDRGKIQRFADEANGLIEKGADVLVYSLPRADAIRIPGIVKLAERLPPSVPELRIVEIKGIDIQACAGTHVKSLGELGRIRVLRAENRGRANRRMYFSLE
jgi:misacylated tRNA(Ala) deacylase